MNSGLRKFLRRPIPVCPKSPPPHAYTLPCAVPTKHERTFERHRISTTCANSRLEVERCSTRTREPKRMASTCRRLNHHLVLIVELGQSTQDRRVVFGTKAHSAPLAATAHANHDLRARYSSWRSA